MLVTLAAFDAKPNAADASAGVEMSKEATCARMPRAPEWWRRWWMNSCGRGMWCLLAEGEEEVVVEEEEVDWGSDQEDSVEEEEVEEE